MYISAVQYKLAQPSPALFNTILYKEQSCAVQCNTVHCTGVVQHSAAVAHCYNIAEIKLNLMCTLIG